jgi:hypothetical protein
LRQQIKEAAYAAMTPAERRAAKAAEPPTAKQLEKKADDLTRAYCKREGVCAAEGYTFGTSIKGCGGWFEWAHLKSRKHRTIKHDPLNYVCLCKHHHSFFTCHPDLWTDFIEAKYPGRWDRLNALLIEGGKPDYQYWIDFYIRQGAA